MLKNQRGMAVIEMIPMLIITTMFFSFVLGFFGAIHSGILGSMASRNYAFETFNNRVNLTYFREKNADTSYQGVGARVHGVRSEIGSAQLWQATSRKINFASTIGQVEEGQGTRETHNQEIMAVQDRTRYTEQGVSEIWIQQTYGICLWSTCEPK